MSPLAPIVGHEKKVAMPPSSSVHGGQYDTKCLACDIRVDGASGIRGGDNFPSFILNQLVSTKRQNTRNMTIILQSVTKDLEGKFCLFIIAYSQGGRCYNMSSDLRLYKELLNSTDLLLTHKATRK